MGQDWIVCLLIIHQGITDNIMLRSKYKYATNWGLLPLRHPDSPTPSVKTYALLEEQTLQQYEVRLDHSKQATFILYNDKQYLHRQCHCIIQHDSPQLLAEVSRLYQPNIPSLTVFLVNQPVKAEQLIAGNSQQPQSILSRVYARMEKEKQACSEIVLSVIGIQSQNLLTDQLRHIDQDSQEADPVYLPDLKVTRTNMRTGKHHLQNATQMKVDSLQSLTTILEGYTRSKNESEYMALSRQNHWDWLQGQLFIFTELSDDPDYPGIQRRVKEHYILRVNQYLKSTSNMMLKLGMLLRKFQQKQRDLAVDLNESKVFKLLNSCFAKSLQGPSYDIHLILQVGCSLTLKEEYMNLAPTCGLKRQLRQNACYQEVSFMYIKHYSNYPQIVNKLEMLHKQNQEKGVKNMAEYVESTERKFPYLPTPKMKSYVMDTFSSLEKRVVRQQVEETVEGQNEQHQGGDLQELVKKTAQLYRQEGNLPDLKARSAHQTKTSIRQRPGKKTGLRLSFADGHMTRQKIYGNRKDRRNNISLQDVALGYRSAKLDQFGGKVKCFSSYQRRQVRKDQRVTSLHSGQNQDGEEKGGETKDMIDKIVKREILELGTEQFYRPDDF